MIRSKWMPLAVAVMLSGSVLVLADDPTTQPAEHHARAKKMVKPWSELSDLTDDQKSKILDLHAETNKEIKAIETKEKTDILALLTDDQKKEITEIEAKDKHKAADVAAPDTQPVK
jgi:Spy/CpxP family protein refolding chaperone